MKKLTVLIIAMALTITMLLMLSCGRDGKIGARGEAGNSGDDGKNASNSLVVTERVTIDSDVCESEAGVMIKSGVDLNNNSILDADEVQNYSFVCDGVRGISGENGNDGQNAVVEIINPCLRAANMHNEIFLRLADGNIVCSFSDNFQGDNTHLALLYAGDFTTSDGYNCLFSVDDDLTLIDQDGNVWKK